MGLFTLTFVGGGFFLIGTWEALFSSFPNANQNPSPFLKKSIIPPTPAPLRNRTRANPVSFIAIALLSFLFILNSIVSFLDAVNSHDSVGSALQLQVLAIASLFFLYSILGILTNFSGSVRLPPSILSLICLFAFVEEFLMFYPQRKNPSGIENRYFDLLLVPITICVFSTILELKSPASNYTRLARGVGLILQGTWFLQMGISFYTNLIVHGCSLHEKSRGNYTIRCKGHPEYHRGRAIATLQFNCHLAFVVVLIAVAYSIVSRRNGGRGDFTQYRPLGAEMQQLDNHMQFTLVSDDEDDEIKEEENAAKEKTAVMALGMNGNGSHQ